MFVEPVGSHIFPHTPLHVGVRCQNDFQNNWADTIDTYGMCTDFIDTIRGSEWVDFYFNLHGASVAFANGNAAETCNPCGGADSVDFFLMNSHGGVSENDSAYAMWDFQSLAWSSAMRFGATGQQLKVFATYVCDTMQTSDGHFWDRMGPAFRGGVKILLGAHDLVYDGNRQKGTEFASRMQDGEPIGQAWNEAVWYADNNNHPSAAATGVDANDCWNRLGMNLESVQTTPPLRDRQMGYVCWVGWNGD
ncbi:MAG TPA: DUF6345 domain-containing protein [Candidatus Dormibacteraeota bacterium]|nr:DUF6345 domain-containing protein [Candidatus Dormibacteraeota bacterium]